MSLAYTPRAYVDWEDDEVIMIHVVYEDKIDLGREKGVPDVDYSKIREYFWENYPSYVSRIRSVNFLGDKNDSPAWLGR